MAAAVILSSCFRGRSPKYPLGIVISSFLSALILATLALADFSGKSGGVSDGGELSVRATGIAVGVVEAGAVG